MARDTSVFLVPPVPIASFEPHPAPISTPEQLWFNLNDFQRSLYSCYSTGSLSPADRFAQSRANLLQHRTNILGPKHFIVEEENEALLAKELQDAKIQSAHNSHSSMHCSQPKVLSPESNDATMKTSKVTHWLIFV